MRYFILLSIVSALLSGCREKKTETSSPTFNIEQLQDSVHAIRTKAELVSFLSKHPFLRDYFFGRKQYPNDSIFINQLYKNFTNRQFDTLLMETHRVFGNLSELKYSFQNAFVQMMRNYSSFKEPTVTTIISGFQTDMIVTDSVIIIGLDYFLGPGAKYRSNTYDYMMRRYTPESIVPSIMLLYGIDSRYNKVDTEDRSVLADMIAYGKAYYFAKKMLPDVADSILIGYSGKEWNSAVANEDVIYKHFVDKEIFYSSSRQVKQHYLEDRPGTYEIAQNCPGRIGTWVGWRMVNAYAERTGQSLDEIMSTSSAQKIFKESHYRPERPK